jgi:hypothetical protein
MKNKAEIKNGFLIFLGIGLFFLLMELVGLSNKHYLRLFNLFIVIYGINNVIKSNYENGHSDYLENLISGFKTGIIGVVLSIIGLIVYIYLKGGESYLSLLSDTFIFAGKSNIIKYCSALLFEGVASSLISSYALMQYWKGVVVKSKY